MQGSRREAEERAAASEEGVGGGQRPMRSAPAEGGARGGPKEGGGFQSWLSWRFERSSEQRYRSVLPESPRRSGSGSMSHAHTFKSAIRIWGYEGKWRQVATRCDCGLSLPLMLRLSRTL